MKFNTSNYEEYALEYLEGSMEKAEQEEFAAFLLLHPEIQEELAQFRMVTLTPDLSEVYADKADLYRRVGNGTYRIMAAVAIIATLLFIFVWAKSDRPGADSGFIAETALSVQKPAATISPQGNEIVDMSSLQEEEHIVEEVEDITTPPSKSMAKSDQARSGKKFIEKVLVSKMQAIESNQETQKVIKGLVKPEIEKQIKPREIEAPLVSLPASKLIGRIPFDRAVEKIEIIHPALIKAFSTGGEKTTEPQSKVGKWLTQINLVPTTFDNPDRTEIKNKILPSYFSAE